MSMMMIVPIIVPMVRPIIPVVIIDLLRRVVGRDNLTDNSAVGWCS
jgi:hypothetical protein